MAKISFHCLKKSNEDAQRAWVLTGSNKWFLDAVNVTQSEACGLYFKIHTILNERKRHQIKETLNFLFSLSLKTVGPFLLSQLVSSLYREKEVLPDSLAECLWESVAFRARIHRVLRYSFSHFWGERPTTGPQGPDLRLNVVGWITHWPSPPQKQKEKWKTNETLQHQSHLELNTCFALFSRRQQWLGSSEESPHNLWWSIRKLHCFKELSYASLNEKHKELRNLHHIPPCSLAVVSRCRLAGNSGLSNCKQMLEK